MITLTERAAAKVKEIASAEGLEGHGLRLRAGGGAYDLHFEDQVGELDKTYESHGVKLYVDPSSQPYLNNTEIDFVDGAQGAGFKFNNTTLEGPCGCGASVSF